jgi:hypothetical protein
MTSVLYTPNKEHHVTNRWTTGSASAIGLGVGAAIAASMGAVGYLLGLAGALGTFIVAREVRRRRA